MGGVCVMPVVMSVYGQTTERNLDPVIRVMVFFFLYPLG
jgi:hypothetical protein